MTIFFGIIAVLIAGTFIFLQTDVFGQTATGNRLERIKKSPHFKDEKFNNAHFTPDLAEGVSYWDILKSYLKKVENKDRKSTRLNSSHRNTSRMPSSA